MKHDDDDDDDEKTTIDLRESHIALSRVEVVNQEGKDDAILRERNRLEVRVLLVSHGGTMMFWVNTIRWPS